MILLLISAFRKVFADVVTAPLTITRGESSEVIQIIEVMYGVAFDVSEWSQ